jgi:heat shock protein HslJ
MRRILISALSLIAVGVFTSGCSSDSAAEPDLTDRTFTTTEYTLDGETTAAADGSTVSVTFTEDGISVNAGCNSMFGDANLADGKITLETETMASTMMACSEPLMAQDQILTELFSSAPTWTLSGTELTITGGRMSMILTES